MTAKLKLIMVYFFRSPEGQIIAVGSQTAFSAETIQTLKWLFSEAELLQEHTVPGTFIGPRREMITRTKTGDDNTMEHSSSGDYPKHEHLRNIPH